MQLTFMGAAHCVTGSKFLLSVEGKNILIDCGLFQGLRELRLRNWEPLPVKPEIINTILLTHAHIDHSGYIPVLIKNGFKGKIFCSAATKDSCAILLPDSGFLHEEEARLANLFGRARDKPALPLYTEAEGELSLRQFHQVDFGVQYNLENIGSFTLHHAGHILGAAFVMIEIAGTKILFSGDIGRPHDPIMRAPAIMQTADYLILESTYGNRLHDKSDPQQQIADIVNRTISRDGTIVMPAFAVGRAQALLYYLHKMKQAKSIPDVPIYLDSPMAVKISNIFYHYTNEHRLSKQQCHEIFESVTNVGSVEESTAIDKNYDPKIIISASGMATGGRVLHHLKAFLPDKRNTILFTGFQGPGTRGARLVKGEKNIKIHGEIISVAAEILAIDSISAHADANEILAWLEKFQQLPKKVFLVHDEIDAAIALKEQIEKKFKWSCLIPNYMEVAML